jgi:hypothetical protein
VNKLEPLKTPLKTKRRVNSNRFLKRRFNPPIFFLLQPIGLYLGVKRGLETKVCDFEKSFMMLAINQLFRRLYLKILFLQVHNNVYLGIPTISKSMHMKIFINHCLIANWSNLDGRFRLKDLAGKFP